MKKFESVVEVLIVPLASAFTIGALVYVLAAGGASPGQLTALAFAAMLAFNCFVLAMVTNVVNAMKGQD
ncbi:MAG TPA: hypothetical protein VK963_03165 [Candidatus Saccharimonadales bacterium]|nr:hypothetical protein [Candidatus Saccharimonadales bacterium]